MTKQQLLSIIKSKVKNKAPDADIILFGSRARGEALPESDWDILILLNQLKVDREIQKEYQDEIFDIELETGEAISTLVFSKGNWEKVHKASPFYHNIKKDGIKL